MLARSRGVVQTTASSGALSPTSSMGSILRGGRGLRLRLGCALRRIRDLPHHVAEVTARVEDVELTVRTVAATQDLVDAREFLLRAEVAREIAEATEAAPEPEPATA